VIPLRPLGVGEILDGSISTGRKHWRTVLPLSLGVAVISETTIGALTWFTRNSDTTSDTALALTGVGLLFTFICGLLLTALLTMVVSKAILGEDVTVGVAWRAARPQLWRLVGLTLLVGLILAGIVVVSLIPAFIGGATGDTSPGLATLIIFCTLAGFLTGFWMLIKLSLAAPALMLEKQGIRASLARSLRLTRGKWWRIFGITALGWLMTIVLSWIISIPFAMAAGISGGLLSTDTSHSMSFVALLLTSVGGVLASTLTTPIQAGINVLLYVDQRIRREALDLELARAAGLPEYGGTGWAGQQPPTGAA
jgi:hypothetical protein